MLLPKPLGDLIAELERLPGVGPKSAQRLAYHLLRVPVEQTDRLASSIVAAKRQLRFCMKCQSFSEHEVCDICKDARRDRCLLCIVAEPRDITAMERIHEYKGLYHVLHGLLNPMDGIGPEQLRVRELLARLEGVTEVILATNPTIEGDATALYLAKVLKTLEIRVTRLAHGMPVGGELDYADSATLLSALNYRREM